MRIGGRATPAVGKRLSCGYANALRAHAIEALHRSCRAGQNRAAREIPRAGKNDRSFVIAMHALHKGGVRSPPAAPPNRRSAIELSLAKHAMLCYRLAHSSHYQLQYGIVS